MEKQQISDNPRANNNNNNNKNNWQTFQSKIHCWTSYCACQGVPTRVHSECFTGDVLASKRGGLTERFRKHAGCMDEASFAFEMGRSYSKQKKKTLIFLNCCQLKFLNVEFNVYVWRRGPPFLNETTSWLVDFNLFIQPYNLSLKTGIPSVVFVCVVSQRKRWIGDVYICHFPPGFFS